MAFSIIPSRRMAIMILLATLGAVSEIQAQDYSLSIRQISWTNYRTEEDFADPHNVDKSVKHNRYDYALHSGEPVLLTTYLPDQYASMPEKAAAVQLADGAMEVRNRKGTLLMKLHSTQLITIQSLLQGKIHNQEFVSQFVVNESASAVTIDMNRQLLRQLLALYFSKQQRENHLLGDFRLEYGKWLVSQKTMPGREERYLQPCGSGNFANAIYSWKIPAGLEALLGEDNTVEALIDLGIEVLSGNKAVSKSQQEDLENTLRIVNEAFEQGRYLVGWSQQFITCSNSWIMRWKMLTPVMELPFGEDAYTTSVRVDSSDGISLIVNGLSDSRVLIELYTEKGSRIDKLCYQHIGEGEVVRLPVKKTAKADRLIYKVTADGRTYSGLIP